MTPAPPQEPATSWQDYSAHLPTDLPDTGYNAVREKYFYEHMAGPVLQTGMSLETAKDNFMQSTARPVYHGAKLATVMTEAGKALTAPISGMSPYDEHAQAIQRYIDENTKAPAAQLERQGISPAPYQMAGQLLGTAPYFAEGLMGPEAVGESIALRGLPNAGRVMTEAGRDVISKEGAEALEQYQQSLLKKAITAGSVSAIQGAYAAASAPEGQRLQSGLSGAAAGAGIAIGFETLGSLGAILRARHGLATPTAKAITAVAQDTASPMEERLATNAVVNKGNVADTITDAITAQRAAESKQGQPAQGINLFSTTPKIGDLIDYEPTSLAGSTNLPARRQGIVTELRKDPTTGDIVPLIGQEPIVKWSESGRVVSIDATKPSFVGPSRKPQPATLTMLGADQKPYTLKVDLSNVNDLAPRIIEHLNAGGDIQSMSGNPVTVNTVLKRLAEANPDAYKLNNPIRDTGVTPDTPASMPQGNSPVMPDGPAVRASRKPTDVFKAMPDLGPNADAASWISPKGEVKTWPEDPEWGELEHEQVLHEFLSPAEKQIYKQTGDVPGWIRQRANAISVHDFNQDNLAPAFYEAARHSDDGYVYAEEFKNNFQIKIPLDDRGEFLADPVKYARQQTKPRFAVDSHDVPDFDKFVQLPGGEILNKETGEVHGSIEEAVGSYNMLMKDKPLARYGVGTSPLLPEGTSGATIEYSDSKATILLKDVKDRATLFHENLHGHFGALGMHDAVQDVMTDAIADQLYRGGFSPVTREMYGNDPAIWREEVYAHGADAIRTGNDAKIQSFADADTDRDTWLTWMGDKTSQLLDHVAEKDDSLHKRVAERRLNAVQARATNSLSDIHNIYSQAQGTLDFAHDQYAIKDGQTATLFPSREEALQYLEDQGEPLNSPELVPTGRIPEGVSRYSRTIKPMADGERPNLTDPPNPSLNEGSPKQARPGFQLFSRLFRPFGDWINTVAQKNSWPELYDAFSPIDQATVQYNNLIRPHFETLQDTLGKWTEGRQKDAMKWFKNPGSDFVQSELRFTPKELDDLNTVKTKVLDPLADQFGVSLEHYVDSMLPKVFANAGNVDEAFPKSGNVKDNFLVDRLRKRSLDPNEQNFAKLVAKYLEFGGWDQHLKPVIDDAENVIQETMDGSKASRYTNYKNMRAGALYPVLQRHVDYLRGQPDFTQEILKGALEGGIDMINQGLAKVNKTLGTKIEPIDGIDEDPLGKYTLFMYAGALALKPATIIRDGLQIMLTTYPIAGKYTMRGVAKAFSGKTAEETAMLWNTAQKYGALIERNDLRSLYTGADEGPSAASTTAMGSIAKGAEKVANWGMRSIQLTHNGNRLSAFWGHTEQVLDALDTFKATGDEKRFTRDSGMWFMNKSQREQFMQEVPGLNKTNTQDFAHRAAKELVELSQWNFKKGANPGLYEYQLGRLFGQYGTWPLNYIEYARRLATADDGTAIRNALTRLTIAHGAILAAGQGAGIDTGRWTFTGPMAYEGGPWLEALQQLPHAPAALTDWTTEEGSEARRGLFGVVPGIDRIVDTYDIFHAASAQPNDYWKRVLGFHVLHSEDYKTGLHQFLPKETD